LKLKIQSGQAPDFATDRRAWDVAQRVYELRNFRPAWVAQNRPLRVESLAAAIENADRDGLDPERLGLSTIHARLEDVRSSDDSGEWIDLDIYLTYIASQFASQLFFGRGTAEKNNEHFEPRSGDPAGILAEAIQSDSLAELSARLAPPYPFYAGLKNHLQRYRDVAAAGGWPHLDTIAAADVVEGSPAFNSLKGILELTGDLSPGQSINEGLRQFESRHGLEADGVLDEKALKALNVSAEERVQQIELNMDRMRRWPDHPSARYVRVNIPAFELEAHDESGVPLRMRVVVGSNENRTPIFNADMKYVVFSPYWNIPDSIMINETLPMAMKDPGYLNRQNIEVVRVSRGKAEVIDPATIDWESAGSDFEYMLRQRPGAGNSLGLVKFMLPNKFNVYLHDTPSDHLFERITRNFSHGCIRLQRPDDFAVWVLKHQSEWTPDRMKQAMHAGRESHVPLKAPIPVHVVYLTTWVDSDNRLQFRNDVYGYDAPFQVRNPEISDLK
jgi:murein L,D-transpeptidase YcbB/YkuD